jgi:DNA (cytosine-5)-methyltransferase 1
MEQLDMFEVMYDELPKVTKLKVGTFFSGIGSPEKALGNIGIDYDLQFFSEIDKYAIKAYCAIHNESEDKCVGSISDLKGICLPYCDLWFGGFPCQDISTAGKSRGFNIESESRSSLGWEMIRLLREIKEKPKYIVFENVAAITNEQHRPILNMFKRDLEDLGYTLYNDLLNAKNYGMPHNRNRYFLIAILGKYNYKFPENKTLDIQLSDLYEENYKGKYILSRTAVEKLLRHQNNIIKLINPKISACLTAGYYKIGKNEQYIILDDIGINENIKESLQKKMILEYCELLKSKKSIYTLSSDSGFNDNKIGLTLAPTIRAGNQYTCILDNLKVRRLTPRETYRLLGFEDCDYNKVRNILSDTQLYKTAGNSIVVNVLEAIFKNLFMIEELI